MAIASADKLVVVKAFAPSNPLPLDAREIYDSLAEAQAYAKSSAIAYAGQTIKVVDGNSVTVYTLVPSSAEGTNYELSFVGGGAGSGVQAIATSTVEGNISVTTGDGTSTSSKNVPVVGALVNPVVDETAHTLTLTKVGATAEANSTVVIPLGGASPDTIISAVTGNDTDGFKIKISKFNVETETSTDETIQLYGAVTKVDTATAGIVKASVMSKDGTESEKVSAITGSVINASYDSITKVLTLPVVNGVGEDGTVTTKDVTIDLKGAVAGAFIDVTTTADSETSSAKHTFTYKDAAGTDHTKDIFESGVRKVAAGTSADKIKVTTANATTGALTESEILVGAGNVKNPTYDADTRKITLPTLQADGTTQDLVINLGKDMVVTSGTYNTETRDIELTITDGSVIKIAAGDLIDVYTGAETSSATVTVSDDNKISVAVRIASAEKVADNVLKVDATDGGLYVSEADFTATKELITNGNSTTLQSAKDYTDEQIGQETTNRTSAIEAAINNVRDDVNATMNLTVTDAKEELRAEYIAADNMILENANSNTDKKIGDEVTARDAAIAAALQTAKEYADQSAAAVGTTWVDFGTTV